MTAKRKQLALPPSLPRAARRLFERFPVATGEDEEGYRRRLVDIIATLQPVDSIEAFWAKDIVDLTLEIDRLRQVEAGLLEAHAREVDCTQDVMQRHLAEVRANFAVVRWAEERGLDHRSDTPEMKRQWARFLEEDRSRSSQSSSADIPASANSLEQSFLRHSAALDRMGRMIAAAEARRRSVLQELERYRAARRVQANRTGVRNVSFKE